MCTLRAYVVVLVMSITLCGTTTSSYNCTSVCTCATDSHGHIYARCVVQRLPSEELRDLPKNLYSLSIENSLLPRVPLTSFRGLESLRILKLANNSIKSIDRGALKTLDNLIELDLRYNDIKTWRLFSSGVLPSLRTIKMSGNARWRPGDDILSLKNIQSIQDITWSEYCAECSLIKNQHLLDNETINNTAILPCEVTLETFFPHHKQVIYHNAYKFVEFGFSPQCLCTSADCRNYEIMYPYFSQLYSIPQKLFHVQYVLGFLVLTINFMIVFVVVCSKSLRTNASFVLVCSMSLSDVLVGGYTLGIAYFNPFKDPTIQPTDLTDNVACPYLGFVFTTGQTTTVFTSLFLTIERYLAIIRCIRPRQKLELRHSLMISLLIWLVGIFYALLPILGVKELQYHKWFQCTMPFHESSRIDDTSLVTLVIVTGFVLIYVVSVAFYLYIYFVFCKSTAHLAIRREARLAKRLSLVVGTNFFFFVVPTVLFLFYVYQFMDVFTDMAETFKSLQGFFILGSWVPVTLLGISSLLNPFIYAFRHQKFRQEVRRLCRRLDKYFGEVITQEEINSPHHHHHYQHHQAVALKMKELDNEQRPYLMRRRDMDS